MNVDKLQINADKTQFNADKLQMNAEISKIENNKLNTIG
jgi:hypothetical protein